MFFNRQAYVFHKCRKFFTQWLAWPGKNTKKSQDLGVAQRSLRPYRTTFSAFRALLFRGLSEVKGTQEIYITITITITHSYKQELKLQLINSRKSYWIGSASLVITEHVLWLVTVRLIVHLQQAVQACCKWTSSLIKLAVWHWHFVNGAGKIEGPWK